ncbi:MAG: hypothetical protein K8S15_12530 [Candidatus Aegiribacteria sp.]|nr:hypothetical protein [Candidatus Aegiribacteria sp.]
MSTHIAFATGDYYNFRILLCATEEAALSSSFETNYGTNEPDTVFSEDTLKINWSQSTPGWNGFDLDTPFPFDGSSNLIVEFQYMGSTSTCVNLKAASQPSGDRCLDGDYPTSPTGTNMPFFNCMRIHYTPTGISEEPDETGELSLTPEVNPLSDIYLNAVSQEETQGVITAYGIDGRYLGIVWEGMLHSGENSITGDRSGLPSGVCFLVLKTGESRALARILLLR